MLGLTASLSGCKRPTLDQVDCLRFNPDLASRRTLQQLFSNASGSQVRFGPSSKTWTLQFVDPPEGASKGRAFDDLKAAMATRVQNWLSQIDSRIESADSK